jgi:methionyl-tRNA formyltransferase
MKLVFCGTPQFAVPTLEALIAAGHEVTLALSQPDKPVGRNGEIHPTPVKQAALAHGITVTQPDKLKHNETLHATLKAIMPDAIIVVAYGRIIPQWMLDLPRYGCINGHGSILPRWRGAAPIQWAIANGDTETGVTTMRLSAGLDTGPMLLKKSLPITPQTTSPDLFTSLADIGAELMVQTLAGLEAGAITAQPQDDAAATLAPILTRDDAHIDWHRTAQQIDQRFRGFQPWPGAYTTLRGKKLIVHAMTFDPSRVSESAPGTIALDGETITVACGNNTAVTLNEVQLEGKKRMPAGDFLRGFQLKSGELLGAIA